MRQGITMDKKIMRHSIMWKEISQSSLETMDYVYLWKIFMQKGVILGHSLCDRVQGA